MSGELLGWAGTAQNTTFSDNTPNDYVGDWPG
jgi:hypothetical protein